MSDTQVVINAGVTPQTLTISDTLVTIADFDTLTKNSENSNVTFYQIKVSGDVYWNSGLDTPTTESGNPWQDTENDIISYSLFESISWIRKGETDATIHVTPLEYGLDLHAHVIEKKPIIEVGTLVCDKVILNDIDISTQETLRAFADVYLATPVPLAITSGTPLSPTTYAVNPSVTPLNFEYTGGSLKYIGNEDIVAVVNVIFSVTSSVNNVVSKFYIGVNGTPDMASEVLRKIGTGADVGLGSVSGLLNLTTNDTIDFFVDVDTNSTITVEKSNATVHSI